MLRLNALGAVALLAVAAIAAAAAAPLRLPALLIDVPFVPQPREGCGAAAISMVMQYWARQDGQPAAAASEVARIQAALYSREARGIRASDMGKYFETHGYRVFAFAGTWADLQQHVERGRPLVLSLGQPSAKAPLHYVVLTGLDSKRGFAFVNDPARGKSLRISRAAFEADWRAGGNWTLLALPGSKELPGK